MEYAEYDATANLSSEDTDDEPSYGQPPRSEDSGPSDEDPGIFGALTSILVGGVAELLTDLSPAPPPQPPSARTSRTPAASAPDASTPDVAPLSTGTDRSAGVAQYPKLGGDAATLTSPRFRTPPSSIPRRQRHEHVDGWYEGYRSGYAGGDAAPANSLVGSPTGGAGGSLFGAMFSGITSLGQHATNLLHRLDQDFDSIFNGGFDEEPDGQGWQPGQETVQGQGQQQGEHGQHGQQQGQGAGQVQGREPAGGRRRSTDGGEGQALASAQAGGVTLREAEERKGEGANSSRRRSSEVGVGAGPRRSSAEERRLSRRSGGGDRDVVPGATRLPAGRDSHGASGARTSATGGTAGSDARAMSSSNGGGTAAGKLPASTSGRAAKGGRGSGRDGWDTGPEEDGWGWGSAQAGGSTQAPPIQASGSGSAPDVAQCAAHGSATGSGAQGTAALRMVSSQPAPAGEARAASGRRGSLTGAGSTSGKARGGGRLIVIKPTAKTGAGPAAVGAAELPAGAEPPSPPRAAAGAAAHAEVPAVAAGASTAAGGDAPAAAHSALIPLSTIPPVAGSRATSAARGSPPGSPLPTPPVVPWNGVGGDEVREQEVEQGQAGRASAALAEAEAARLEGLVGELRAELAASAHRCEQLSQENCRLREQLATGLSAGQHQLQSPGDHGLAGSSATSSAAAAPHVGASPASGTPHPHAASSNPHPHAHGAPAVAGAAAPLSPMTLPHTAGALGSPPPHPTPSATASSPLPPVPLSSSPCSLPAARASCSRAHSRRPSLGLVPHLDAPAACTAAAAASRHSRNPSLGSGGGHSRRPSLGEGSGPRYGTPPSLASRLTYGGDSDRPVYGCGLPYGGGGSDALVEAALAAQLTGALADKARLAQENDWLRRQLEGLQELLHYSTQQHASGAGDDNDGEGYGESGADGRPDEAGGPYYEPTPEYHARFWHTGDTPSPQPLHAAAGPAEAGPAASPTAAASCATERAAESGSPAALFASGRDKKYDRAYVREHQYDNALYEEYDGGMFEDDGGDAAALRELEAALERQAGSGAARRAAGARRMPEGPSPAAARAAPASPYEHRGGGSASVPASSPALPVGAGEVAVGDGVRAGKPPPRVASDSWELVEGAGEGLALVGEPYVRAAPAGAEAVAEAAAAGRVVGCAAGAATEPSDAEERGAQERGAGGGAEDADAQCTVRPGVAGQELGAGAGAATAASMSGVGKKAKGRRGRRTAGGGGLLAGALGGGAS